MNDTTTTNGPLDEGVEFFMFPDSELQISRLAPFASTICGFDLKLECILEFKLVLKEHVGEASVIT